MAYVLPKTIDKASLPFMFEDFVVMEIQDVWKTLPLFALNNDVCAILPGLYSFRVLPCDKVEHLINRLPSKSYNLDPMPATYEAVC